MLEKNLYFALKGKKVMPIYKIVLLLLKSSNGLLNNKIFVEFIFSKILFFLSLKTHFYDIDLVF